MVSDGPGAIRETMSLEVFEDWHAHAFAGRTIYSRRIFLLGTVPGAAVRNMIWYLSMVMWWNLRSRKLRAQEPRS